MITCLKSMMNDLDNKHSSICIGNHQLVKYRMSVDDCEIPSYHVLRLNIDIWQIDFSISIWIEQCQQWSHRIRLSRIRLFNQQSNSKERNSYAFLISTFNDRYVSIVNKYDTNEYHLCKSTRINIRRLAFIIVRHWIER
jgi:hypothetical protein